MITIYKRITGENKIIIIVHELKGDNKITSSSPLLLPKPLTKPPPPLSAELLLQQY
jgi:hypothetical protein